MATASNSSLTQSSAQSVSPSVEQANAFEPSQVTVAGGIILVGALVESFKWSPSSDTGNTSFIPDNLKEINQTSAVSLETPTGIPISQIPNPPQINAQIPDQISDQLGVNPIQTGSNLVPSQTGLITNSTPTPPDPQQSEASTELKTPEQKNQVSGNLPRINSFFEPKLIPQNISIDVNELNRVDQEKVRQDLGFAPFIWYSDIQIEYKDIKSFTLKYDNSLPTMSLLFSDSFGIMRKKGLPADDTLITIFFNSRSKNLRSIKIDFKVYSYTDLRNGSYSINGIIDIPLLYTRKFESFQGRSSHEVIREVAKNLGCGFCSNINDTNDRMCWINPGNSSLQFMKDVLKNSYVSDDTFLFSYVDFYYNICYVDLNKELTRNINEDVMVNAAGFDKVKAEGPGAEEKIVPLQLSNDPSFEGSNGFISEFSIINNSTKISIFNSYRTRTQYWNFIEKEVCEFDIETITPEGKDIILLKGRADDTVFFRENVDRVWLGKRDSDNSHVNYNYSELQNKLNLEELGKIGAKLTLASPNLNLYLFQKVKVIFSVKKLTPTNEEQFMARLTGDWLIVGIELNYSNGRVSQVISVIKTSLSLTPEEAEKAVAQVENKEKEVAERNANQEAEAANIPIVNEVGQPNISNCGGPGRKEDKQLKIQECRNCLGEQFINLVQGFAPPASFAGQKIATVQELEKLPIRPNEDVKAEILPIINSDEYISKYTKGHRMFALVWAMKEGYNGPKSGRPISRSYKTKNPGNIGNTDNGDNKSFNTLKEGLDLLMKFLKDASVGQGSSSFKFGQKTIQPTWSPEVANNPNSYKWYLNGDKSKPIGCLPGYTGDYQGQLGAFTMIYALFSRVNNGDIAKLSAIFGINGYKKKIDGNTLLSELITFNDPSPINFDFKK